ncbi:MAG: VOC family protein [Rhodobacterales bacterium]|nr:VOC family protein [Rhodobacterales bacterium]
MLVPELTTRDPDASASRLAGFGFSSEDGLWRLGSQALRLVVGQAEGHGRIDHIALTVPDMDAALARLFARGIALDPEVTPLGPEIIPEFWGDGLRYVYLLGPQGARIELCQRISGAPAAMGSDHVGLPCHDISTMLAFFLAQGATPLATFTLSRPEGVIPVRFLAFHGGVIELYQPSTPARVTEGHWSRLLVQGLPGVVKGPEGLDLAPL